jgi:hypothetical protein
MALTPFAAPGRSTPYTSTPLGLRSRGGQIKIKSQIKSYIKIKCPSHRSS